MKEKLAAAENAVDPPGDGRGATILIVEDSPVQAELLRRALEGAGYQVIAASNGAEGLALAKAHHPAAVVSDINMPIMDGYAMCQALRREESLTSTPVILLTMLSDPQDVIRGLNAGADAYLTKPYNIPALVSRLASLLAYPPAPPPPVERRKIEVRLNGETHLVDAHGPRMLNLLISTYENAVLQNRELTATQQALDALNQHLEQKVLEKTAELRESEQRFRALTENASDLVMVIDSHGMITYVSPSARRVGGYEPGELFGKRITAFIHPDDIPTALTDLSALVHNPGTLHTTELRYRGKDGDWIILETVAKSAIDDPAIAGVVVNARDITERKQAEQALKKSEARYRSYIEVTGQLAWVTAADGRVVEDIPTWRAFTGLSEEQVKSWGWTEALHPDDRERAAQIWREAVARKGVYEVEYRVLRHDGIYRDFFTRGMPVLGESGGVREWVGTSIDITERRLAEAARAELAALVASSHDAIYGSDVNGIVTVWNPGAEQMFGYGANEVVGRPVTILAPADLADEPVQLRQRALGDGRVSDFETVRQHKDGRLVDVAISVSPIRDASGNAVGMSIVARDIAERKQAQEEHRRLNWALRALGQSNSALVHAGTEKELFQTCCDAIAGSEGYPLAWIGLTIDDPAHSVAIAAAAGDAVTYLQDLEVSSGEAPHRSGPAGTAIRTGATQVANNLAECEAYLPWVERARARGLASAIALPIRADGGVMGALMIYGREVDAFARAEVELFEELAADIGYGIASRRTLTQRDHLQQEQLLGVERLKSALIGTIGAVALTVEKRDPYTAGHQQRVAELCVAIGRQLDLPEDCLEGLRLGATIHDIGKIYVPAEILNRPGKLSKPEFEIITSHPQVGYDIVKDVTFPWPVREMILQHHERLDGSGYPQGLKGDEIILEARILAVADVIEAMSSHRPYRAGLGLDSALAQVRQEAGTKLDAQVVDACERVFREQGFSFSKA